MKKIFIAFNIAIRIVTGLVLTESSAQLTPHSGQDQPEGCHVKYLSGISEKEHIAKFEKWMNKAQEERSTSPMKFLHIPVIVHVIHKGEAIGTGTNLSTQQIVDQITSLNNDFNRRNHDTIWTRPYFKPVASGLLVKFALATRDPDGIPLSEPGVNRVYHSYNELKTKSRQFDLLQEEIHWPADEYLNIYVADLPDNSFGIATFPAPFSVPGILTSDHYDFTDGVLVNYQAFGTNYLPDGSLIPVPYDLEENHDHGRTLTHEVGHWMGLLHIWGIEESCSVDDFCTDTPEQFKQTGWANLCYDPDNVSNTCPDDDGFEPDMYENYMDYSNDACQNMFTRQQVQRMLTVMTKDFQRKQLMDSKGAHPIDHTEIVARYFASGTEICVGEIVTFTQSCHEGFLAEPITDYEWTFNNNLNGPGSTSIENFNGENPPSVTFLTPGEYEVILTISNGLKSDNFSKIITVRNTEQTATVAYGFEAGMAEWKPRSVQNFKSTTLASHAGNKSVMVEAFSSTSYEILLPVPDYLVSPTFDYSLIGEGDLSMDFFYAHQGFNISKPLLNTFMEIGLSYSLDCGHIFINLWKVEGEQAATSVDMSNMDEPFLPEANEWAPVHLDLNFLKGQSSVTFAFTISSNYPTQNLFIDDVQVSLTEYAQHTGEMRLYPNPIEKGKILRIENSFAPHLPVVIRRQHGETVYSGYTTEASEILLPELEQGLYLLEVQESQKNTKKLRFVVY